jgi:hypothetical protein
LKKKTLFEIFIFHFCFIEKTIRRKRSRKSFLPDQRSSDSQLGTSAPVVYVSSMIDIQQPLIKSSPKSDIDHDNNPLLISDDDNDQTKKGTNVGGGEDECAVDGGTCLKPSGSSIKCKFEKEFCFLFYYFVFFKGFVVMHVNDGFILSVLD